MYRPVYTIHALFPDQFYATRDDGAEVDGSQPGKLNEVLNAIREDPGRPAEECEVKFVV